MLDVDITSARGDVETPATDSVCSGSTQRRLLRFVELLRTRALEETQLRGLQRYLRNPWEVMRETQWVALNGIDIRQLVERMNKFSKSLDLVNPYLALEASK